MTPLQGALVTAAVILTLYAIRPYVLRLADRIRARRERDHDNDGDLPDHGERRR